MSRFVSPRVVALLAAAGLLTAAPASAGDRPHKSSGTAQFVNPTDFVGSGEATHLGRYTEAGTAVFSPTADPTVLRVDARTVYTAANGAELRAEITGELDLLTGAVTATVTYAGGTGRFEDAVGTAELSGQMLPDGTLAVSVAGAIDY